MQVKKQQLEPDVEQLTGSILGNEYDKAVYCQIPVYLTYAEYIMRNAGMDELQAGIKIAGRNINNFRYAGDSTLMGVSEEESKESLYEGERGQWKIWLKIQHSKNWDHGIWSHHFTANIWGQ